MLRTIVIMTNGGVLLFSKEFFDHKKNVSKMLAGLLIAMLTFTKQKVGFPIQSIEFTTVSLSIYTDNISQISCAILFDIKDGLSFGNVICKQVLSAFINTYAIDIKKFINSILSKF